MVMKSRTETEQKRKNGAKRLSLGACGGILIGVEKKSKFAPIYHHIDTKSEVFVIGQKKAHLLYALRSFTTL